MEHHLEVENLKWSRTTMGSEPHEFMEKLIAWMIIIYDILNRQINLTVCLGIICNKYWTYIENSFDS